MPGLENSRYVMLGSLRIDLIWCNPGHFIMGCSEDEEGDSEDAPLHQVTLTKGFWLARFPTTQAQYEMIAEQAGLAPRPSKFEGENRPVERVTWVDAHQVRYLPFNDLFGPYAVIVIVRCCRVDSYDNVFHTFL